MNSNQCKQQYKTRNFEFIELNPFVIKMNAIQKIFKTKKKDRFLQSQKNYHNLQQT